MSHNVGSAAGLILFTALRSDFLFSLELVSPNGKHLGPFERFEGIDLFSHYRTSNQKGIAFVQILIISVTLIVVVVPEGIQTRYMLLGFTLTFFRSPIGCHVGTRLRDETHDL